MQLASGRLFRWLSVILFALLASSAYAANHNHAPVTYDRLPVMKLSEEQIRALPQGQQRLDRELNRQAEYSKRWHEIHELVGPQHISRRSSDFLRGRGLGPALMDKAEGALDALSANGGVDTLKILIIRIGFDTNRDPQLTTIQPHGDFDLGLANNPDTLYVDPPPHNKAFYESHLQGLSEYYRYQSGGRLHIQGEVLPRGDGDSYKLTDVADYGPGADDSWSLLSLENMVRDCMTLADAETQTDGSGINLADYDDTDPFRYVIFVHAGSDYQSDINQDSPNDIPTFFITLGEPQALTSINSTTGLPGSMSECSIIPETTNQDGYPGSIAAAFYHEFGHALGLVDIYNTDTALPQVGIWDLMDSGTNLPATVGMITDAGDTLVVSATGVLPPSLGVWNKWFLGWVEMDEIDGRTEDYILPPVGVLRSEYPMYTAAGIGDFNLDLPQAIKAGLSPREWFLIENRWVPPALWQQNDTPFDGLSFERDEETGVILYLAGRYQGTWSNSGLYDYYLPAGGVLVWQINMDRIESELATNTVNYYGDGIRLVEADGIQDIGVLDAYVLGWFGGWRDPFGEGNGFRDLFTDGFPSSRSVDRSWTGVSLSGIQADSHRNEALMAFKAHLDPIVTGFPFEVAPVDSATAVNGGSSKVGPRTLDVASSLALSFGNEPVLIFGDKAPENWDGGDFPSSLFAINGNGEAHWTTAPNDPVGLFHHLDAPLAGPPAVVSAVGSPVKLVAGTISGQVTVLDLSADAEPSVVFSVEACDSLLRAPLPVIWDTDDHRLICSDFPATLLALDLNGVQVGAVLPLISPSPNAPQDYTFRGESAVLAFEPHDMIATPMDDGWFLVQQGDDAITASWQGYPRVLDGTAVHSAVVPDSETNSVQYHLYDGAGALGSWIVGPDGSVVAMDPIYAVDQVLVTDPAVADVDGDGRHDIILATAERILAFHPNGVSVRGFPVKLYDLFPLPDSTRIKGPLVVADATGDGVNEIFFNSSGGHLIGLDAVGTLLPYTPLKWSDRRESSLSVGPGVDDSPGRFLWLTSAGGYTGAPLQRQFTNGRISAYQFKDAGSTTGTSEWLGKNGGALRRGTSGTATHLGSLAPMDDEQDQVFLYPNPLHDDIVKIRFVPKGAGPATMGVFNMQGELIVQKEFSTRSYEVNEYSVDLSQIVSGLYVCRLMYEGTNGTESKVMTLAVER